MFDGSLATGSTCSMVATSMSAAVPSSRRPLGAPPLLSLPPNPRTVPRTPSLTRRLPISGAELARIESDVRQQEHLIAGYQKENERLSDALKGAKEAHRAELARAEDETRRLSLRVAELERTQSERMPDTAREQVELANARAWESRDASEAREAELRYEIDRL